MRSPLKQKSNRKMNRRLRRVALMALALAGGVPVAQAVSVPLLVAGGLRYDSVTETGYANNYVPSVPGSAVNNSGVAVGWSEKQDSGNYVSTHAVRWDGSGGAAELGNLGLSSINGTLGIAYAINDAGAVVGSSQKYDPGTTYVGTRAVRWNASGTAIELDHLGLSGSNSTSAEAYAVNSAGAAAGWSEKYDSGAYVGFRAVRWDASGAAIELEHLGLNDSDSTFARAYAINDSGTTVGYSYKHETDAAYVGTRAVRWNASGVATELENLGLNHSGYTEASAFAVNAAGTAVGQSKKYNEDLFNEVGFRAVRWEATGAGTAITELDDLGLNFLGRTHASAVAVNDAGTAVGYSEKYEDTNYKGQRAVRWDWFTTAATELAHLGLDSSDRTNSEAYAVNIAGAAVGVSEKYVSFVNQGERAVIWLPDASVIDLNDLGITPVGDSGSWVLQRAHGLSSDGWVAGAGIFTPAVGDAYQRQFVTQVGLGGTWTDDFSGSLDGTWGRGTQWSTGTPAIQWDADFSAAAAYTVGFDRDEQAREITIAAGQVTFALGSYTLTAHDGLIIQSGATLASNGTIIGNVVNHGTLAPGNSPGPLTIDGDYTQTGILELEITGAGPGEYDIFSVTGILDLSGIVRIIFDGYIPADGDSFQLLQFGSLIGDFDLDLPSLPNLTWDVESFLTNGSITAIVTDDPGNGPGEPGEPGEPGDGSVPEPASAMLLLMGAGLLGRRRR